MISFSFVEKLYVSIRSVQQYRKNEKTTPKLKQPGHFLKEGFPDKPTCAQCLHNSQAKPLPRRANVQKPKGVERDASAADEPFSGGSPTTFSA